LVCSEKRGEVGFATYESEAGFGGGVEVTGDEEETSMGIIVSRIVRELVSSGSVKGGGDVGVVLIAGEGDNCSFAMVREVVESSERKITKMKREIMVQNYWECEGFMEERVNNERGEERVLKSFKIMISLWEYVAYRGSERFERQDVIYRL